MLHALHFRDLYSFFAFMAICLPLAVSDAYAAQTIHDELVYHAALGEVQDVHDLIEKGANPNAANEEGVPAISLAAQRGDSESLEIIKALTKAGANLNVRDKRGETPLMNAIAVRHLEAVHYLISNGADFYAVNTAGRNVLAQAEWAGDERIIALIEEAIRLDEAQRKEKSSRGYMYDMLDDYIFNNCALQYLMFYKESGQDPLDEETYRRQVERYDSMIQNAQIELEYNFEMPRRDIEHIGKETQVMIYNELEALISNRNRRKHGVGSKGDLDKRCGKILNVWRKSFEEN